MSIGNGGSFLQGNKDVSISSEKNFSSGLFGQNSQVGRGGIAQRIDQCGDRIVLLSLEQCVHLHDPAFLWNKIAVRVGEQRDSSQRQPVCRGALLAGVAGQHVNAVWAAR